MFNALVETLKEILGLDHGIKLAAYMVIRGLILYIFTMFLLKTNKKFLGIRTPANFILFVMLGSICAAAVTGDAPFLPVIVGISFLMLINKLVAIIFFKCPKIEGFFIGAPILLVSNGSIEWANMEKNHITENVLRSTLQAQLHTNDISNIEMAYLATDGTINFIVKKG